MTQVLRKVFSGKERIFLQLGFLVSAFVTSHLFACKHAYAGWESGEDALSQGYNAYFDALSSGKPKTPAEREQLRKQYVEPPAAALDRQIQQRIERAVQSQFEAGSAASKLPELDLDPGLWARIQNRLGGNTAFRGNASSKDSAQGGEPSSFRGYEGGGNHVESSRPEKKIVIDGSNIPKVIEFQQNPKKKKKAP